MKILSFVKALLPRIEKEKIIEDIRVTASEFDQVVSASYSVASDHFKSNKFKSDAVKDLSDYFYKKFDLQGFPKQSSMIGEIAKRMQNLRDNTAYIQKLVEDVMERDVINEGLTAKKAITIRAAEHLSFISRFSIDLLNFVYVYEAAEINVDTQESMRLTPADVKHINSNISAFATLVSDYGIATKDFQKLISTVPDIIISSKSANSIIGVYKEQDIDPFSAAIVSGFTYNPIYHVRLLVAEWQSNRYKANKDKKKMLELRLLHIQLLSQKKQSPQIESEINYIQGRVDKIQRYLKEVEESLEE